MTFIYSIVSIFSCLVARAVNIFKKSSWLRYMWYKLTLFLSSCYLSFTYLQPPTLSCSICSTYSNCSLNFCWVEIELFPSQTLPLCSWSHSDNILIFQCGGTSYLSTLCGPSLNTHWRLCCFTEDLSLRKNMNKTTCLHDFLVYFWSVLILINLEVTQMKHVISLRNKRLLSV